MHSRAHRVLCHPSMALKCTVVAYYPHPRTDILTRVALKMPPCQFIHIYYIHTQFVYATRECIGERPKVGNWGEKPMTLSVYIYACVYVLCITVYTQSFSRSLGCIGSRGECRRLRVRYIICEKRVHTHTHTRNMFRPRSVCGCVVCVGADGVPGLVWGCVCVWMGNEVHSELNRHINISMRRREYLGC